MVAVAAASVEPRASTTPSPKNDVSAGAPTSTSEVPNAPGPTPASREPARAAPDPTPASREPVRAAPGPTPASREPARAAPDPTPASREPARAAPDPTPASSEPARAAPDPTPASSEPAPTASTLAAETLLLERARSALRRDDHEAALAALDLHDSRFPQGLLLDEARSTRLRALCAAGRSADAHALADRWAPAPHRSRWHDVVAAACR
jgi:hypothetical protein